MDMESVAQISGIQACGICHMTIARFAPQVVEGCFVDHRECYEAWYFGRHGRRPALLAGTDGNRHRFRVLDRVGASRQMSCAGTR